MSIKIITPGLMTSVQDCGRYGYQASGFSVSGALEGASLEVSDGAGVTITIGFVDAVVTSV